MSLFKLIRKLFSSPKPTRPQLQTFILEPILTPSGLVDAGDDLPDVADVNLPNSDLEEIPFFDSIDLETNNYSDQLFTSGVFTVGDSGQVSFEFIFDGGGYEGELAIFSLEGMDEFEPGSDDFVAEAARRALTDSEMGKVVISDLTQAARFSGELGEANRNFGEYVEVETFDLKPGGKYALMLVPDSTVERVSDILEAGESLSGSKQPLFSLATANPDDGFHLGQIADVDGAGSTFAMEDLRVDGKSDGDYNDIIFQVKGAEGEAVDLDKVIDPEEDWRDSEAGEELLEYVALETGQDLPVDPETEQQYKPGEILVKFSSDLTSEEITSLAESYGAQQAESLIPGNSPLSSWYVLTFNEEAELLEIRDAIAKDEDVVSSQLNVVRTLNYEPNDEDFDRQQWNLKNTGQNRGKVDADIDATEAWDLQRGSEDVVVAVIDSGVDYEHPDLEDNIWTNPGEAPIRNFLDDDGNGYYDDYYGFDFGNYYQDPHPGRIHFFDFAYDHGTHVAGIIGAVGDNNIGIAGVSPDVSLMSLKVVNSYESWIHGQPVIFAESVVQAINYAVDNGANIINASFGGSGSDAFSDIEFDAVSYANDNDVLFVASAGNDGKDNDLIPHYPANHELDNVISVAATNRKDELWLDSNFGEDSVDLGAPGVNIWSTLPNNGHNGYGGSDGTSAAAPHVAGVAALLLAQNASLTAADLKRIILDTVDPLDSLQGKTVTGGRLNAYKALQAVLPTSADGTPEKVGDEFQVNTYTDGSQSTSSAASLQDGGYVVTWQSDGQDSSNWGIYAQRYNSNGNPLGNEFQVNTYTSNLQQSPSIASLPDGGFVVTWYSLDQDGDNHGIYGQRYDSDGNPVDNEFQVNTYTDSSQANPSVASLKDGGFVVTWQSFGQDGNNHGIYGQRYDSGGNPVGNEFQVNTYTDSSQANPSVASLKDGEFVITWRSGSQDGNGWGIYGQRYDRNGNPVGGEFQVNTYTDNSQAYFSVASLLDGGFVVTWGSIGQDERSGGVYGQRYDSNGNPVDNEFQANTYTYGFQYNPSVTSLPDGGFVITWDSYDQDGDAGGIYGQRYDKNGNPLGEEFQVNTWTINTQFLSSVVTLADGDFIVTWLSEGQDGSERGVFAQHFAVEGLAVNDPPTLQYRPTQTYTENTTLNLSSITVRDIDSNEDITVVLTLSDEQAGALSSTIANSATVEFTNGTFTVNGNMANVNAILANLQFNPTQNYHDEVSIALTVSDGKISQTINGGTIELEGLAINDLPELASISLLEGATQYQPYTITYEQLLAASNASNVDSQAITFVIAQVESGSLTKNGQQIRPGETTLTADEELLWLPYDSAASVSAFRVKGSYGGLVSAQEVEVNVSVAKNRTIPQKIGDEFQVNTYTNFHQDTPSITALANGGFVITWHSQNQDGEYFGIYGQRYDINGNPVGNEFQVNTYTNSSQALSSVASLQDGGFIVTWQSQGQDADLWGIYGQKYDKNGNPVGDEFQVNTYTDSSQVLSSVAGLQNGEFVVAWYSFSQDGETGGIYGQKYDKNGNLVGNEFQINTYTDSEQSAPSIASLQDGGFVVTWYSDGQDGGSSGIYGQRYDSDGNPIGNEFQVNTYTNSSQRYPSVASLPEGGFIITWQSLGQDGDSWGIYGQGYDSDGNPIGNEFQVNTYTNNPQSEPSVASLLEGFVVTWDSYGQDENSWGVFAQRFVFKTTATFITPDIPYLSFADSPFKDEDFAYFHLEDLEDGQFNTPGVTVSEGTLLTPRIPTDSVDGDDGVIDGSGNGGHSWYLIGKDSVTYTFDQDVLGQLPTHVGIVFTDVSSVGLITLKAFDSKGNSLGKMNPVEVGDGTFGGATAEDRFFGVNSNEGIARIEVALPDKTGWEVDHLQYGLGN